MRWPQAAGYVQKDRKLVRASAETYQCTSLPGAQAIFAKLADVFLSQALRTYLAGAERAGLLRPRQAIDAHIAQALTALHDQPAVNWTLAEPDLGQAAGYLATTSLSVEAIARRTGYGTNASLSKAFKREFGTSPGRYRENNGSVAVSSLR